jgi:hypothetical protein
MTFSGSRPFAVLLCAVLMAGPGSAAFAQAPNTEQKPADQQKPDPSREAAKRLADELAEIGRTVSGPAGNPECAWIGRHAVRLMSQDDLDTAFRHLELYDRFGCPGAHVQAAFRCLIRQGTIDPKSDTLDAQVRACWLHPTPPTAPAPAAAAAPAPATGGTGAR